MAITVSAVVLLGLLTLFLLRARYVTPGVALVLILFGLFLADTGAARPLRAFCTALVHATTNIAA